MSLLVYKVTFFGKQTLKIENDILTDEESDIYSISNMYKYFSTEKSTPEVILSSITDIPVAISNKDKSEYIISTYLLIKQFSNAIIRAKYTAEKGNSWRRDCSYATRLEAIKSNIENREVRNSDLLGYIMAYCRGINQGFPPFFFNGSSYFLGESTSSTSQEFQSFGTQLFEEFWNLDLLHVDLISSFGTTRGYDTIARIKAKIMQKYITCTDTKLISREIIADLRSAIQHHFEFAYPTLYTKWSNIIGADNWEATKIGRNTHPLFEINEKIASFLTQMEFLEDLLHPLCPNPANEIWTAFALKFEGHLQILEKFIAGGREPSIIFAEDLIKREGKKVYMFMKAFKVRKGTAPDLRQSQLMAVDLLNQQLFDFFNIFAEDGLDYANHWGDAMCHNALNYRVWKSDKQMPIGSHRIRWFDLSLAQDLIGFAKIRHQFITKGFTGYVRFPDSCLIEIRGLNEDEMDIFGYFSTNTTEQIIVGDKFEDHSVYTLNPNAKVASMKGDKMMRDLCRSYRYFRMIAIADPYWSHHQRKGTTYKNTLLKGIVPDGILVFHTASDSVKIIDTAILFEKLDNFFFEGHWYGRQKQFDVKALMERGLPYIAIGDDAIMVSSFLNMSTNIQFTRFGKQYKVPRIIGYNAPLITKLQSKQLGQIFRSPNLLHHSDSGTTIKVNRLSFKEIILNLDGIVGETCNQLYIHNFSVDDARRIQTMFGIIDGEICTNIFITRPFWTITGGESYVPMSLGHRTYILRMEAFWQNIDNANNDTINSLIAGLVGDPALIDGSAIKSRKNLLHRLLVDFF